MVPGHYSRLEDIIIAPIIDNNYLDVVGARPSLVDPRFRRRSEDDAMRPQPPVWEEDFSNTSDARVCAGYRVTDAVVLTEGGHRRACFIAL